MKLIVIIPSFQRENELYNNLSFWQDELSDLDYNILVSNASSYDELKLKFTYNKRIVFLDVPERFWWSESINFAIEYSMQIKSTHIMITNDDMTYPQGIIRLFLNHLKPNEILTIPQLQTDGNIYFGTQIRGFFKTLVPVQMLKFESSKIDLTNGSCLFLPTEFFLKYGLFNSLQLPHYFSDLEFLLRMKLNNITLRIINFNPIIQGPPTQFYKRFSRSNIFFHKGSPLKISSVFYFGTILYGNYFNLIFGRGFKYLLVYFINIIRFQLKKYLNN